MSTGSFAAPDTARATLFRTAREPRPLDPSSATPLRRRAARCIGLLLVLGRLWAVARFRAHRLSAAQRAHAVPLWAARLLDALCVEVRVRGHRPAADAAHLLVANHISWIDSYALQTVSAARFVAKSEVREWPLIGTIAARFETIFLKRWCYRAAARAVGTLTTALCADQPTAVFPEATTSDGSGVLPFYPAMFQAAVLSGARVQPVAIRYRNAAGVPTPAPAFVGDTSVLDSLRSILREPRLTAELIFCAPLDSTGRTRRELAALARAAIAAALDIDDGVARGRARLRRAA